VRTPQVMRRIISPVVAHQMNVLLRGPVYGSNGTAHRAQVADFTVAGKTGTAQMVNHANGTYFQNRLNSSFVGFLPANDPRLLILVVLYDVGHAHFGGLVAAPVFSSIATGAARELGIATPQSAGYEAASIIPLEALRRAESLLTHSGSSQTPVMAKALTPGVATVPEFNGLSLRAALALARSRAINVEVKGAGYVVAQNPPRGAPLLTAAVTLKLAPAVMMASAGDPKFSPRLAPAAAKRVPFSKARRRGAR
ncbi:MAG: penicillin-binding transpeptidase domain-containing protein, partial [Candidatus Binataceae bacterium]